jgi:hypothetical protein
MSLKARTISPSSPVNEVKMAARRGRFHYLRRSSDSPKLSKKIILPIAFIIVSIAFIVFGLLVYNSPSSIKHLNAKLIDDQTQSTTNQEPVSSNTSSAVLNQNAVDSNTNSVKVIVNGQSINVPENGSLNQSIDNVNGHTNINVSNDHTSNTSGGSSSSNSSSTTTTVNVNQSSN